MEKERIVREGKDREKLKKSPRSYVKARSPGTLGHAGRLKGKAEKIVSDSTAADDQKNKESAEEAVSEGMEASSSAVRDGSNELSRQMQKRRSGMNMHRQNAERRRKRKISEKSSPVMQRKLRRL